MVSKAEAQRRYRQRRALATGPDADVRLLRDAALHCERQKRYRTRTCIRRTGHAKEYSSPTSP